jgi:hypothetical protein
LRHRRILVEAAGAGGTIARLGARFGLCEEAGHRLVELDKA